MTGFDVIVAGGGPAGLAAACLLAQDGRHVGLISGAEPSTPDPRTVALMQPSIRLLSHLGLWPGALRAQVAALKRLRMVDDTGAAFKAPAITFDAGEIGEEVFGWNFPLALLIPALSERAVELGVKIITAEVTAAQVQDATIEVTTTAGVFASQLALAADGRKSVLREAAGLAVNAWHYEQTALATSFDHSADHDGTSTEYHRAGGPFTTVPMAGRRSSLVWMERPARATQLMALPDHELCVEIQLATHGELGLVSGIGARKTFAMEGLIAKSFAANRTLLIGEAGHVVPPIGAQGLNMSLRDAAQAAELIAGEPDPGAAFVLHDYDRLRRRDVQPRQQMIDLMNRSLLSGFVAMETARALSLELIAGFGPLRRYVMKRGLGPVSSLPRVMKAKDEHPAL